MTDIDMTDCKISGLLPSQLGISRMTSIYLGKNQFSGPIPSELALLPPLLGLDLSRNQFAGTIHPEFTNDNLYAKL